MGDARFDDVVEIGCSSEGVCSLSAFDASRVAEAGSVSDVVAAAVPPAPAPPESSSTGVTDLVSACEAQRQAELAKRGAVDWDCRDDGGRAW